MGSEKGRSLISAYRSLAITASTSGFEKLLDEGKNEQQMKKWLKFQRNLVQEYKIVSRNANEAEKILKSYNFHTLQCKICAETVGRFKNVITSLLPMVAIAYIDSDSIKHYIENYVIPEDKHYVGIDQYEHKVIKNSNMVMWCRSTTNIECKIVKSSKNMPCVKLSHDSESYVISGLNLMENDLKNTTDILENFVEFFNYDKDIGFLMGVPHPEADFKDPVESFNLIWQSIPNSINLISNFGLLKCKINNDSDFKPVLSYWGKKNLKVEELRTQIMKKLEDEHKMIRQKRKAIDEAMEEDEDLKEYINKRLRIS